MLERHTVSLPDRRGDAGRSGGCRSTQPAHIVLSFLWMLASSDAKCVKIHVLIQMYTDSMTDSEDINALNSIYKYTSGGTMAKILKTEVNQNDRNVNDLLFFFVFCVLIN